METEVKFRSSSSYAFVHNVRHRGASLQNQSHASFNTRYMALSDLDVRESPKDNNFQHTREWDFRSGTTSWKVTFIFAITGSYFYFCNYRKKYLLDIFYCIFPIYFTFFFYTSKCLIYFFVFFFFCFCFLTHLYNFAVSSTC